VRLGVLLVVGLAAAAGLAAWLLHAHTVDHWLAVHTGTDDPSGPYYGFWSGFGSDLAEFGTVGAIGTAAYQLVKKYNCHQAGCWRVGNHPAAGGQFFLCYRHHPEYQGRRPTAETIARLHQEHLARQAAVAQWLHEVQPRPRGPGARHHGVPHPDDQTTNRR
jgi:hypothetical protein